MLPVALKMAPRIRPGDSKRPGVSCAEKAQAAAQAAFLAQAEHQPFGATL